MAQIYQTLGTTLQIHGCTHAACSAMTAITQAHYERAIRTGEDLWCSVGHPWHFVVGETKEQRLHRLEVERLQGLSAQDKRLREEAERRASDAETERLKATREMNTVKRQLRKSIDTASSAIKMRRRSHKKPRDVK